MQYDAAPLILHGEWIRYDIHDCIELFFHLRNRKLFRITTLGKYEGKLFDGIAVGSTEDDMLRIEPSFVYDEFEDKELPTISGFCVSCGKCVQVCDLIGARQYMVAKWDGSVSDDCISCGICVELCQEDARLGEYGSFLY